MGAELRSLWRFIRRLSGDDAYERYLDHFNKHHRYDGNQESAQPLSKAEFFKQWQDQKWNGIKRCC
ncbi:MAG: CstA-like transporter-associated (seleno)protein [Gammaproteobacteria bacterium]